MTPDERDRLAKLEQQMLNTREDMGEIKGDVKTILSTLAEARGGWKTLFMIAGAAGALGAFLAKVSTLAGFLR